MTLFAAMSNETVAIIVAAVLAVLKFVEKVYDNWQAKKAAATVAKKVEEVKETTAETAAAATETLGTIHRLVNSQMGDQKRTLAAALRSKAELTNSPEDKQAAEKAEKESTDHDAGQRAASAQ